MQAGLFDVISGHFSDGESVFSADEGDLVMLSVISNLNYLFNTRRGYLEHLPDYGLPDITEIYRDIPDSVLKLQTAIREVIEKYEPRLRRVRVEHHQTEPFAMRLVFLVSGELSNRQRVRFETTFSSTDPTDVRSWQAR